MDSNDQVFESGTGFLLSDSFQKDVDLLSNNRQYLKKDSVELIEATPSS